MGVLDGVRVVEMGLWIAGPAAGGLLADWGAEVIKVEAPSGDPMRGLFGALSGSKEQRSPGFDFLNRGKRRIALLRTGPRTATVTARGPVRLFALARQPFLSAVTGHPLSAAAADLIVTTRLGGAPPRWD